MKLLTRIADTLNKNLAVLAVVVSAFALIVPSVWVWLASRISIDLSSVPLVGAHFPSLGFVNILLGIVMLGMGMTLRAEDFALILKRPGEVFLGVCCQYILMAGFGFLVAELLKMTGIGGPELCAQLAVGLVLLGCVPGGTAANVMTFLAKGDVPLSITIIMSGTLAAPVLTSGLVLLLAGQWVEISFLNMFFSIAFVVLMPIILGLFIHHIAGNRIEPYKKILVLISTTCVLLIIGTCVGTNRSSFTENGIAVVAVSVAAVLLQHILGLISGYAAARFFHMDKNKAHTISLDTGLQNSGLSCTLANSAFPGTMVVLPCVLATVIHQVIGPIAANHFAKHAGENA
ncbi:MAG: bile acid:sodium symporter family protein [Eubacteriales bacterium]|nr:bile acid:sodium symporter family protein [Eubacteriales bacterium]